jgi:hypothetical protein
MEGDNDIMQNLYEFKTGVKLHYYLAELDASTPGPPRFPPASRHAPTLLKS